MMNYHPKSGRENSGSIYLFAAKIRRNLCTIINAVLNTSEIVQFSEALKRCQIPMFAFL